MYCPMFSTMYDYCGSQRCSLSCHQSEELKITHAPEWGIESRTVEFTDKRCALYGYVTARSILLLFSKANTFLCRNRLLWFLFFNDILHFEPTMLRYFLCSMAELNAEPCLVSIARFFLLHAESNF